MIYIFGLMLIFALYDQWDKLMQERKNFILFIVLSMIAIVMGCLYMFRPYSDSIANIIEKYMN